MSEKRKPDFIRKRGKGTGGLSFPYCAPGLVRRICRLAEKLEQAYWPLARNIHARPEPAFQEKYASSLLCDFLSGFGFKVEKGIAGLPTAFRAVKKARAGGPRVAFLAEMDALPGLGHACGHHLIAASSAASAAVMARVFGSSLPGVIEVIGTPAEELGGGKILLARRGVFSGLDAVFIVHPDRRTEVFKRALGVLEVELVFRAENGKTRERGILGVPGCGLGDVSPRFQLNALDAVIETFTGVNLFRQSKPWKSRIHGIISQGGEDPDRIPEAASALFLARGMTAAETMQVAERVVACGKGAAKAAGVSLRARIRKDKFYAPYKGNRVLGGVFMAALQTLGVEVEQGPEDEGMGSTDVGNVSIAAPTIHPLMKVPGARESVHTREFERVSGGPGGRAMLKNAVKALALSGSAMLMNPSLVRAAWKEHLDSRDPEEAGLLGIPGLKKNPGRNK